MRDIIVSVCQSALNVIHERGGKKMIKRELTPAHLRCTFGYCNAVYELEDNSLLIVGKVPTPEMLAEIKHKIANDEFAINIPKEFFSDVVPNRRLASRKHTDDAKIADQAAES